MRLFGKKKSEDKKKKVKEFVICPHCYVDYTVEQIEKAKGICPSCKGEIDLSKLPRAQIK